MEASLGGDHAEFVDAAARQRRKRTIIVASIVAAIVVALAAAFIHARRAKPVTTDSPAPAITVVVPGRHAVSTMVPATGNIGARRDMPVGVAGEGGRVTQVLVEAGDWVKAGQVLAIVDRSVQTQQAAALAATIDQARADSALAAANLDRAKKLVGNGFISRADLDTRQATLASANARVGVAQAQLRQQQALIGRLDIRAPTSGLVLARSIEAGQIVGAASGALFRIAMDGAMEMQARMAEDDLARLHVGSPATVTPVGTALKIAGQIWQISPIIDPTSRQGTVRVALPYNTALRPGGFASAEIGGGNGELPLLPQAAVLSDSKGNYVFVVGAGDKIERRDVTIGDVDDRGVSVTKGLTGTEQVVASAGAFLNIGDKVRPTRQAAAQ